MNVRITPRVRDAASLSLAALLAIAAPARLAAADTGTPPATAAPEAPAATAAPETPSAAAVPSEPDLPPVERSTPADQAQPRPPAATYDRGDLVTIGNNSELRRDERCDNMVTIMGNALVDGQVRGDSVTIMGNVTVTGTVNSDLVCILGNIMLGPGAEVRGEAVCIGGTITVDPTARIRRQKTEIPFFGGLGLPAFKWLNEWIHDGLLWGRVLPHNHAWAWITALVFLFINVLFAAIFRRPVEAAVANLERKPVICFVGGMFSLMLLGPLLVLLTITVVGILVVPFVVAGMFIASYTGTIAVYRYSAEQLGVRSMPLVAVLVGNVVFVLLYAVPALGIAVWGVTGLIGLGASVIAFREGMRRERQSARPPPGTSAPTPVTAPAAPASAPAPAVAPVVVPVSPATSPHSVTASEEGSAAAASLAFAAPEPAPAAPSVPKEMVPPVARVAAPLPPVAPPVLPAADTLERAGIWPRLVALVLDTVFVIVAFIFLHNFLPFHFFGPRSLAVVFLAYHIAFWSWRGTTPGGLVMNLRIERLDGGPITPGIATVRALSGIFSIIPGGFGLWAVAWDEAQQTWHDKIAGTIVVRDATAKSFV